jgi:hypothetical protein
MSSAKNPVLYLIIGIVFNKYKQENKPFDKFDKYSVYFSSGIFGAFK